jgi:hypothetical protein
MYLCKVDITLNMYFFPLLILLVIFLSENMDFFSGAL